MQRIKFVEGMVDKPLPCDYFNMMCGMITGGSMLSHRRIISLCL